MSVVLRSSTHFFFAGTKIMFINVYVKNETDRESLLSKQIAVTTTLIGASAFNSNNE